MNSPVVLLYEIGAEAERDVVVIFALNVAKSADERYPLIKAVEVASEKVQRFPDDDAILIPVPPEVEKVSPFHKVIAPVEALPTSPPPAVTEEA